MKLDDIDAFVAVVRCQSLSLAAQSLSLTQPAITRRVQSFEHALGVELLDRNTKPLKPTPTGRQVYEQCRAIVREVDTLRDMVATDTLPTGGLRLGVAQIIGDFALLDGLRDLRADFPELEAHVVTGWGATLLERLGRGEFDAVAIPMPANKVFPDSLDARSIGQLELVVVAPRGQYRKRTHTLLELQSSGWVLNPEGCVLRTVLQRAVAERGVALNLKLETAGSELQLGLVAQGVGLGLVTRTALAASVHASDVDVLNVTDFKPTIDLWIVQTRLLGKLERPVVRFGATIQQAFRQAQQEQLKAHADSAARGAVIAQAGLDRAEPMGAMPA
jgi:DNA-binding transcriptional LysR family regulator